MALTMAKIVMLAKEKLSMRALHEQASATQ